VYIPARREAVFLVVLPVPLSRRLAEKEKQVPRNSKEKAEFTADREAPKKLIRRVASAASDKCCRRSPQPVNANSMI
jgi:hypothetical protein